jgi:hypothetical protein
MMKAKKTNLSYIGYFAGWIYQVKSVSHPTEPANSTSSYITGLKGIEIWGLGCAMLLKK